MSFFFLSLTSVYLLSVGVEVAVTLDRNQWHRNPHSGGLLWTKDHPSQKPLPDNTQHSQGTENHASAVFEPAILASERPQTHVLERATTGIGRKRIFGLHNGEKFLNQLLILWLIEDYVTLNVSCFEKKN